VKSPLAVLIAVVAGAVLSTPNAARAEECSIVHAQACAAATAKQFRGAIIVPGSEAANRAVARNGGCDGCDWTLVVDCDLNEHDSDSFVHCSPAKCPDGTTFRIYLQRPDDANPAYVDSICLTATRRIVTAADLASDMDRYLKDLRPPEATIAVQPAERAVTGLPAYFAAGGDTTGTATLDVTTAAGPVRLDMDIAASRYVWTFGDGARCETASPGGSYDGGEPTERCDDRVAHVYDAARTATVMLTARWSGTYTFDVGYGPVGPLDIPGNGVPGPAATRTIPVRDATAQLIGG
jgi:hypothetical protein